MGIESKLVSLKEAVEKSYFFNVPIYQRLYVWESDQVKTLLEDILQAYSQGKDIFYLGGVLVVENDVSQEHKLFDLIDGQQRFTTLWMMSLVLGHGLRPFQVKVGKEKVIPRIKFPIRDDVNRFFIDYLHGNKAGEVASHIQDALGFIESFYAKHKDEIEGISSFIYERVKMVFTIVPKETDLNKLFEVINNRGIQLQQHEILKAQLLSKIKPENRFKYGLLWDACSSMDSFLEKNIKDFAGVRISDLFDNKLAVGDEELLADPTAVVKAIGEQQINEFRPLQLGDILQERETNFRNGNSGESPDGEYEADEVGSIITFPILLLHTLRIFRHETGQSDIERILDKELLEIFSKYFLFEDYEDARAERFIEMLWSIRYCFDKHVIKWVETDGGRVHLISKLSKAEKEQNGKKYYSLRRMPQSSDNGEALLQSMLYHSQQITTHYWLTPYLKFLLRYKGRGGYLFLKHLDNNLLCSVNKENKLIERSYRFMQDFNHSEDFNISELSQPLGLGFRHYWFYKLEYVLWEKISPQKSDRRWKDFKISAKNSIEHISPQQPKETDFNRVSDNVLNAFGNLALVSRSINSEYSNLPFNEKRQRFINNNTTSLDSLKMDLIYANDTWSDEKAEFHQKKMLEVLETYLNEDHLKPLNL